MWVCDFEVWFDHAESLFDEQFNHGSDHDFPITVIKSQVIFYSSLFSSTGVLKANSVRF